MSQIILLNLVLCPRTAEEAWYLESDKTADQYNWTSKNVNNLSNVQIMEIIGSQIWNHI